MSYTSEVASAGFTGGAFYGAERADAGKFEKGVAFDFRAELSSSAVLSNSFWIAFLS